jgi:PST family polysaccharide transporter
MDSAGAQDALCTWQGILMSVKRKAIHGILWTGLAKASMQGVIFIIMLVLARLLSPEDFGIVGMAAIVTVAISLVNDRGLGTAIIQKNTLSEDHYATVFWGGIGFSLLLLAGTVLVSVPMALFFKNPAVQAVVAVQGIGFVIGSLGIVQKSILNKDLEFKKLAVAEVAASLVSGMISIGLALMRFGVWSLVIGALVRDAVNVALVWIYCSWRPRLFFSWKQFHELFAFSAKVLGNDVASYAVANIDVLMIGRLLGTEALGYYTLALNLVKIPVARLSGVVSKVAFPAFSAIQDDMKKLRKGFLKSSAMLSMILFPLLLGLGLYAEEFIRIFMGAKWLPMAMPLIILVPMGLAKSVGVIRWPVLMALGRPDIELKWNLAYILPLGAVIYLGARWGLVGAAAGISLLLVLTFPLVQTISDRIIRLGDRDFYISIAPAALAGGIMAGMTLLIKAWLLPLLPLSPLLTFVIGVLLSGAIYLLALILTARSILRDMYTFVRPDPKQE